MLLKNGCAIDKLKSVCSKFGIVYAITLPDGEPLTTGGPYNDGTYDTLQEAKAVAKTY